MKHLSGSHLHFNRRLLKFLRFSTFASRILSSSSTACLFISKWMCRLVRKQRSARLTYHSTQLASQATLSRTKISSLSSKRKPSRISSQSTLPSHLQGLSAPPSRCQTVHQSRPVRRAQLPQQLKLQNLLHAASVKKRFSKRPRSAFRLTIRCSVSYARPPRERAR